MKIKLIYLLLIILIIFLIYGLFNCKETFSNFINENLINNLNLNLLNVSSPYSKNYNFYIYLDKDYNIIYKKINKLKIDDLNRYKEFIYNLKNIDIISNYVYLPEHIYIENDGSYYSMFIKNGVTLFDVINKNKTIDYETRLKIIEKLKKLKIDLNEYSKTNSLFGDWNPSNIIYDYDTEQLYNIDYEGLAVIESFHIIPYKYSNPNDYFDKLISEIM
jgi:hypothetical protein